MGKPRSRQSSSHTAVKISRFDSPTRYLVESESRPDEVHLVDLDAEDNRGCECSCEDWEFRNKEWLSFEGVRARYLPYECKHIKQVKIFLTRLSSAPDLE
jgi:hypothetical protein